MDLVTPDWPAPGAVHAFTTTREGGVSQDGHASLNLGGTTGDAPQHVAENRRRFTDLLPGPPGWLNQVHGGRVLNREALDAPDPAAPTGADAAWCAAPNLPCTVLTADCLPVLFCDREATVVAAAHAGWRGLAGGVLEATVEALPASPHRLLAWIGPGIGLGAYEVGEGFRESFRRRLPWLDVGFERVGGQVHADLPAIAGAILRRTGIRSVHGGNFCTYTESARFYSHRRNPRGGRMATTIWLDGDTR